MVKFIIKDVSWDYYNVWCMIWLGNLIIEYGYKVCKCCISVSCGVYGYIMWLCDILCLIFWL